MHQLAVELNNIITEESPTIYEMLSKLGQNIYMPKGIISQSAQAKEKAYKYNASIGVATENNIPLFLKSIHNGISSFDPKSVFNYAPTAGNLELREFWKKKLYLENPSLKGKEISTPVVVNAITHGLSVAANLFCNDGDYVILPDKFWGNYRLIFNTQRGGIITTYPLYNENNTFNVEGLLNKVKECAILKSKIIVLLNFPNNPTGYTISDVEANFLVEGLKNIADSGINLVVMVDDAYFGMFYDTSSIKESIFGKLVGLSPNLLAIKLDGATKEYFAWGFRVGFITFGSITEKPMTNTLKAMETKVTGYIRGTISSGSALAQTVLLEGLKNESHKEEQEANIEILKERYLVTKKLISLEKYSDQFVAYPFNSGYFFLIKLKHVDSEELRLHLLNNYGVGTISTSPTDLRIAFSCVAKENIEDLINCIYNGCLDIIKK